MLLGSLLNSFLLFSNDNGKEMIYYMKIENYF